MKIRIYVLVILEVVLFTLPVGAFASIKHSNLDTYNSYFYNRYSKNFDAFGLKFAQPSYGFPTLKSPDTPREWMQLSSYYKYRAQNAETAAISEIRSGIFSSLSDWRAHPNRKLSFADSIAAFLAVRMSEFVPNLLDTVEKDDLLNFIESILYSSILTYETENRAVIAGAHWQYLANYLYENGRITAEEKLAIDIQVKLKIDTAIKNSITKSNWYFEAKRHYVSPHYHTVTAFMLMFYAEQTKQVKYAKIAKAMYLNIKKVTFRNGMVEAKYDIRPIGLGAQFYLMQGLLGKYANDDDYRVYLTYAKGSRFFSNRLKPNALEFHSTRESTPPEYNEDVSFIDAAEVGLVIASLQGIRLQMKNVLTKPIATSTDSYFKIQNNGRVITVNNKKVVQSTNGNSTKITVSKK